MWGVMTTIYDVAKAANVSPKTVSRVLNGDAPVKPETRDAVEQAIASLSYVPSSAARTMRSNRSGLVGLVTGAISVAPQATEMAGLPEIFIVQGIQRRMEATGKTMMISDTGGRSDRVPHLIRTFTEHRAEGLIYVASFHQQVVLPTLPHDTRLVLVNCFDEQRTPAVLPDDQEGQRRLVRAIIARGHTRIAYLSLSPLLIATALRTEGYRDALAEAGLPFDPELVAAGEDSPDDPSSAAMSREVARLLSLAEPPTVICCGNDRMAMRLYGVLRSSGYDVPRQISVAGYDDYRLIAETLFPPLTTVELPYVAMGVRGAERLLSLIGRSDPAPSDPERIAGDVMWRDSVMDRPRQS
jgi:LacI family transcriptional regulator